MKWLKYIGCTVLVCILFVGGFIGSYFIFKQGSYDFNPEYLSRFDEDNSIYYLQKAPTDVAFCVDINSSNDTIDYDIVDNSGNVISRTFQKNGSTKLNILPPKGGYAEGERYTLTLSDNLSFSDENLKNARVLVFCIEREAVEKYEFKDSVIEVSSPLSISSSGMLDVSTLQNINVGDIVYGTDTKGNTVIYQIQDVINDQSATVVIPSLDDVYEQLEVYGDYVWDVESIAANPELELEIVENVRNSKFYEALLLTAYAAEVSIDEGKISGNITPDKSTNSIELEIQIKLEPGDGGLFGMPELKHQAVTITLKTTIGLKLHANINGINDWDVSASVTSGLSWSVDISLWTYSDDDVDDDGIDEDLVDVLDSINKFSNGKITDYYNKVNEIQEKLNSIAEDATNGQVKIFDWNLPIPSVPGLVFSAEIELFLEFEVAADVVIGNSNTTIYTIGLCYRNEQFKPYSNTQRSPGGIDVSLRGKAEVKAGVALEIEAVLFTEDFAYIELVPKVGLYADFYVTIPVNGIDDLDEKKFIYSYFEPGVFFSAEINASLNLLIKKFDFSQQLVELKFPIEALTYGNEKIAMGITTNVSTVRAIGNRITAPSIMFEYYDVPAGIKGTDTLDASDVKFTTSDGTSLSVDGDKITLPDSNVSNNFYITATYKHSDGRSYSTIFRVLVSGSILEGKVSAYTADASTGELEGATVKLFTVSNKTAPIGTVRTDENGKFSFNVAKGNYILEISSDGYKTLISQQTVNDDEIKYTEHILLIDDTQSGLGSAGGRVTNALDGKGLGNVTLKLRTNWNNTEGAYYGDFTETTNSSGYYSLTGLPVGYYTVEASLNGYVTGYTNIIVLSENAKTDFDFTITPILSNNEIRIVLTWGSTPSDLDSHLIGRTPSNDTFNVYYSDKVYRYDGVEMANLDVDDTSSYGPETVTILQNIYGVYTYAVHDYSNGGSSSSTALSYSGAVVRVFMGSTQVAEYHVPTDQIGTYWTVFQIDGNGHIVPINSISNTKPSA